MTRASILAVTAMALLVAAPSGLRADDTNPFGLGSSPFGKALDDQKIRDDMAKMRYQLDHQTELLREGNPANSQRNGSQTRGTARSTSQKRSSEPSRDLREWQREQLRRNANKRKSSSSSSRGSASKTPAS